MLPTTAFDTETALQKFVEMADALALNAREMLAAFRGTVFKLPDESEDHLAYRDAGNPNGQLSELGRTVMLALLKLGLTDQQVSERMSVTARSVTERRHSWGLEQAQRG